MTRSFNGTPMRAVVLAVAAAAALSVTAVPARAEQLVKAISSLPQNLVLVHSYLKFIKEVNAETKGKINIRYLGGPEVTPPRNAGVALSRGVFDVLHSPTSYYAGKVPEGDALLGSTRTPAEVRKNGGFALLNRIWNEKLNAEVLGWFETGVKYNTYLTKKPKITPEGLDLTGLRMRTTATYRELFQALGGTTVAMKSSEIYTGLERGIVQGFGFPGVALLGLGINKIVKYRVDPQFYTANNLVVVNLDKWKTLSKDVRAVLKAKGREYEEISHGYIAEAAKKEEAVLIKGGMQIITLKDKAAKNYLNTAYEISWARLKKRAPKYADLLREKFYR